MTILFLAGGAALMLAAVLLLSIAVLVVDPLPLVVGTGGLYLFCAMWWWALKGWIRPDFGPQDQEQQQPYYAEDRAVDLTPSALDDPDWI